MDLLQLKYFAALAKKQHINATAQEMMVTPSAVSSSLARLEKEMGLKLFDRDSDEIVSDPYIRWMHEHDLLVWVNSIVYNEAEIISAGHTDDISLTEDPEKGWGWLLDRQVDFIQTDWLLALKEYMEKRA